MDMIPTAIKSRARLFFSGFLLIAAACAAVSAHAQAPPTLELLQGEYKYRIAWNGIKIGRVNFYFEETEQAYRVFVDTKTSGVARMFHALHSTTTGNGRKIEGRYIPEFYHANSNSEEGKGRVARLYFNAEGMLERREVSPPEDPLWRPEVPADELIGARDPVTAFFVMRQEMAATLAQDFKTTGAKIYDGRRLAEISVHAIHIGTQATHDDGTPMLATVITRQPMNGYTPKELKKFEAGDPAIHIYFSRDNRLMPLLAEAETRFGTISATLEKRE